MEMRISDLSDMRANDSAEGVMCRYERSSLPSRLRRKQHLAAGLETLARRNPYCVAVNACGPLPLKYGSLLAHIKNVAKTLSALGVGRNDRVAMVLPNGPAMVTALLGVMSCAIAAPLNPSLGATEFEFYLSDLNVKALMIHSASDSPAREIARARGMSVLELSPVLEAEAGVFKLSGETCGRSLRSGYGRPENIALVLHTSGTTSRPKIVPLTHAKIFSSAENIGSTLGLTQSDRCLSVMPLFHIHGLMVTLSSLLAGGSVYPFRFDPENFFQCVDEFSPTWYSAVPTMHQAILRAAETHRDVIERSRLRFVRSSSAALPIRVKAELERVFNAPVIEAYGMTEAAHQMTSDPLPPSTRKTGSVGLAAGPQVAIMDAQGNLLEPQLTGEIVIRGANVFQGYENNPAANSESFTNGWFRTGDQGYLDSAGYLFITGRLKDIINRGGEKISPQEVDEVLLRHPAIEQAVSFPVPHPTLGEDIVAAVVLQKNATATEREIRDLLAAHIAGFKVPRRVLIVEQIPKGPTGKLQRRGLAEQMGLLGSNGSRPKSLPEYVPPVQTVEHQLVQIWEELLPVRPVGIRDSFFDLGGDSLLAVQMMQRLEEFLGRHLPLTALLAGPTIENLTKALVREKFENAKSLLVPVQSRGSKPPLFFLHWDFTGGGFYCLNLSRCLGENQPFYALAPHGTSGESIPRTYQAMAASYIEMVRAVQPKGPYMVGGMCSGAIVAFEMAQQLTRQGDEVPLVVLVSPPAWNSPRMRYLQELAVGIGHLLRLGPEEKRDLFLRLRYPWFRLRHVYLHSIRRIQDVRALLCRDQLRSALRLAMRTARGGIHKLIGRWREENTTRIEGQANLRAQVDPDTELIYSKARASYVRRPYSGRAVLFWPVDEPLVIGDEPPLPRDKMIDKTLGWGQVVSALEVYEVPGSLYPLVTKHVKTLAELMNACLDKARLH